MSPLIRRQFANGPAAGTRARWPLLLCLLIPSALAGQDAPQSSQPAGQQTSNQASSTTPPPSTGEASPPNPAEKIRQLETKLAELEANVPDATQREQLAALYNQAIGHWKEAQSASDKAALLKQSAENSANTLDEQKKLRDEEIARPGIEVPSNLPVVELEQRVQEAKSKLDLALEEKRTFDASMADRLLKREAIPVDLKQRRADLAELEKQLALPPPPDEPEILTAARKEVLSARREELTHQIRVLEQQEAQYESERPLLPIRNDILTARTRRYQRDLEKLQTALNDRRRGEAQDRLDNARYVLETYSEHPDKNIISAAKLNVSLAEEGLAISQRLATLTVETQSVVQQRERVQNSFTRLERRASQGNSTLAILMGREKDKLPDLYWHRQQIQKLRNEAEEIQNKLFEWQELREELGLPITPDAPDDSEATSEDDVDQAAELIDQNQRDLIDDIMVDGDRLFDALVNAAFERQQLLDECDKLLAFIDERILWLRSDKFIQLNDFRNVPEAVRWLLRRDHWSSLGRQLYTSAARAPVSWLLLTCCFLAAVFGQRRMRQQTRVLGDEASRGNCMTIAPTLRAMLLIVVRAGIFPAALLGLGTVCLYSYGERHGLFIRPMGNACISMAALLWPLEVVRIACRPKSLGPNHFFWSSHVTSVLSNTLTWFNIPAAVIGGLVTIYQLQAVDEYRSTMGRFAFVTLMAFTVAGVRQIIHPRHGLFSDYLKSYSNGWLSKLRWVWYPALLSLPLVLLILAIVGYIYTAWQLSLRLYGMLLIILVTQLVGSLLFRWLRVNRRRLTVAQYRARVAREGGGQAPGESRPIEDAEIDLVEVNVQTQRLIRSGLMCGAFLLAFGVWADVLPAFRSLDRIVLWHTSTSVSGELLGVTVADALAGLVVVIMTVIAARNLPGLMEIAILQHLPIDSAVRYAITTMGRYLIVTAGVVATAAMIGISWSNIQWLVAAMGVGLGFGLQEVVANFVCGVILMFERPIRVGDIITLGDVTGRVSRIRIRATTLSDWDGKELVVPNKDLITGRLLNWTLTDSRNRVVIHVGIAYGSNVSQARDIILRVTTEHPEVLDDPVPSVTFEQFGGSSLNLVLRAFLGKLDNRLATIHDLHDAIHTQLGEAGIEIAFPQQDLHIRGVPTFRLETAAQLEESAEPAQES